MCVCAYIFNNLLCKSQTNLSLNFPVTISGKVLLVPSLLSLLPYPLLPFTISLAPSLSLSLSLSHSRSLPIYLRINQ